ncbi:MORN repeat variant [Grimontia celer]|uniref:MORN repeat variant n=1 Tax=Grimontia celer TaxID=1796497 RepID=A0A128EZG8_9GAMM|nr:hypothetical protein [Grimontia celer]CZF79406.1 MORN repeat variant [Grimontia celer]
MERKEIIKWSLVGAISLSVVVGLSVYNQSTKYTYVPPHPEPDGPYVRYYWDEVIAEKGNYLNNEKDGEWEYYWNNGQLRMHGSYLNGERVGLWVEYLSPDSEAIYFVKQWYDDKSISEKKYCKSGSISSLKHFTKDEQLTGDYYEFYCVEGADFKQNTEMKVEEYQTQAIKVKASYVNGELDGEYLYFHSNGKLADKLYFDKGSKEGEWTSYDTEGRVIEKGSYQGNVKIGVWEAYEEGALVERADHLKEQRVKYSSFHMNGQPKERGQYYQDMKVGGWEYFDSHGRIEKKGTFENGMKQGAWLTFKEGIKHSTSNYQRDFRQGDYQKYYPSGKVFFHCTMKNDKCDGKFTIYHENGKVSEEGNYLSGYREGPVTFFYESGAVYIKANYSHNHFIDDFSSYYESGNLESSGKFVSQFGYVEDIYGISSEIAITGERYEGEWLYYYDNGNLRRKGSFEYGERTGLWYYYDLQGQQTELRLYETGLRFVRMKDELTTMPNHLPELDVANEDYYYPTN